MAVAEMAEPAQAEVDPVESDSLETSQSEETSSVSEPTGEPQETQETQETQESEAPISAEELMEILEFREQRAERARRAAAQGEQGGQPQGGAQPAQAQSLPPVPVGPFKMAEEMKAAFSEGDFEGGFNAFGDHLVGQIRGSRDEIVVDALDAMRGELEKALGGIQARMMKAAGNVAEMSLFLNPKIYPDNADIAGYGKDVFECAMRQAYEEMPDASIDKWQERAAEIIRKDGVRTIKAIRSGKVIDQRPGRKPANDFPHVGGGEQKAKQQEDGAQQWDPIMRRLF